MVDNMRIWGAVSKTDPKHTKHVNQRGGFTAIGANYQIKCATEQFGPIGEGWGYTSLPPLFTPDNMIIVPVTLWHGSRDNVFGPEYGCAELVSNKGHRDSDAPKKATTDAITKLLSRLGFNADVFLGMFDDNKYVAQLQQEFAPKEQTITEDQVTELMAHLDAMSVPVADFLGVSKIKKLDQLPAGKFEGAKGWITKNAKQKDEA